MKELVLLKLGGSVITDKTRESTVREDALFRLAQEIAGVLRGRLGDLDMVVGHGSGSFGHHVAHQYRTHLGNVAPGSWQGFAETARAAARLHGIVVEALQDAGVPVLSVQPSASALCRDGQLVSMGTSLIRAAVDEGLVPVVYGDVALDESRGFTIISTEKIFEYVCTRMSVDRIVLAGMVDGVYDADPLTDPNARRFSEIGPDDWEIVQLHLSGSHGVDVTGGMASKVRHMLDLVQQHPALSISIISGDIPGNVVTCLDGSSQPVGTTIRGHGEPDRREPAGLGVF